MAFHSNLETDYDPDYLDSKVKIQYLLYLSGKSQRKNNYIFVKLMNQRCFCYLIAKPKNGSLVLVYCFRGRIQVNPDRKF